MLLHADGRAIPESISGEYVATADDSLEGGDDAMGIETWMAGEIET